MLAVEVEGFGGPAVPWTVQDFKKQPTGHCISGQDTPAVEYGAIRDFDR